MHRLVDTEAMNEVLADICRRMKLAAPVYARRVEELSEIQESVNKLKTEEAELNKRIQECRETTEETLERVQVANDESYARLEAITAELQTAVLREAAIAKVRDQPPLIEHILLPGGETNLVRHARMRTRVIEMKARLLEKLDRLSELRRRVFCLGDDEEAFADIERLLPIEEERATATTNLVNSIQTEIESQQNVITATDLVNSKVSEGIQGFLKDEAMRSQVEFSVLHFPVRERTRLESIRSVNLPKSKVSPNIRAEITREQNSLLEMRAARIDLLNRARASIEVADAPLPTFLELFVTAVKQFAETQKTIEKVATVLQTNNAVPVDVWRTENAIHQKMQALVSRLNRLVMQFSQKRALGGLKGFGYSQYLYTQPLVVEETMGEQVERCKKLIEELETAMRETDSKSIVSLEAIDEQVAQVKVARAKLENIEQFPVVRDSPVSDEWKQREAEFLAVNKELVEKQKEEIRIISDLLKEFPGDVSKIEIDCEEPQVSLETIQLPAQINIEEATVDTIMAECETVLDSNDYLIAQIHARRRGFNPDGPAQIGAPTVLETLGAENTKLADTFSDCLRMLEESANPAEINNLLHKKEILREKLQNLRRDLRMTKERKRKLAERRETFTTAMESSRERLKDAKEDLAISQERLDKARKGLPRYEKQCKEARDTYNQYRARVDLYHSNLKRLEKIERDYAAVMEERRKLDEEIAKADQAADGLFGGGEGNIV